MNRCGWVNQDPLYIDYHDHEWGVPVYDDQLLFEYLNLEGTSRLELVHNTEKERKLSQGV